MDLWDAGIQLGRIGVRISASSQVVGRGCLGF